MKKHYYCYALLAFGLLQVQASTLPVLPHTTPAVSALVPPDCELITPVSATATTGNAALAIDSNGATRWESDAADPQSLTVNLGALTQINSVSIDWETANAKDYVLRGSVDGTTWVDIATQTNMPAGVRTDVVAVNAQYQWLKMDGVTRNTPYGYSIYEFYVCSTAIVPPPVCNAVAIASAEASTGTAALAVDGNGGTRWESEAADPQSLTVDLGEVTMVHGVNIDWETANAKDYYLRGSVDGTTWTDIVYKTDMPTGPRTDAITEIDTEYRWLKMDGVTRNTPYGYSIYEFEVCGEENPVTPVDCDPVAATGAEASTGAASAVLAIDGNDATRWESEAADPQTLTIDLGTVAEVDIVTIHWETANAKDYTLSGSADGTTWTEIGSYTNMAVGERTDVIGEIEGDYRWLKINGTARNTPYGYSIYEVSVCGEAGETPVEAYTVIPALIEAEDYNAMSGIQTEATTDEGGGESVGYTDAGDYMDYNISVPANGTYTLALRVASAVDTGAIQLMIDGVPLAIDNITVPNTGGWQVWQTISIPLALTQGQYVLRLQTLAAAYNLNWLNFTEGTAGVTGLTKNGVVLYPNPAHGVVTIKSLGDGNLDIYNQYGALVHKQAVTTGENTVDVSNLATGVYMVTSGGYSSRLIIK